LIESNNSRTEIEKPLDAVTFFLKEREKIRKLEQQHPAVDFGVKIVHIDDLGQEMDIT